MSGETETPQEFIDYDGVIGAPDDDAEEIGRTPAIRRVAVIELFAFLAVALAADFIFGDGSRFMEWAPHPFWLIVVLLSVQYGPLEGLLAATMSTLFLLVGNLPEQSVNQDYYGYIYEISLTPIMWMVASVIFGGLRQRQIVERDQLRRELEHTNEREQVLIKQYRKMHMIKGRLEERIAGQLKTVFSTYRAAKGIESLGVDSVFMGMSGLVESVLMPRKHSIFLLNDNKLKAAFGKGWDRDEVFEREFDNSSPLFQAVVGAQEFITVANFDDEAKLQGQGIMAGPLINYESGQVIGMLKIEDLDFLDYNIGTTENFKVLCDWLATAYTNAHKYERTKNHVAFDPDTKMISVNFFDWLSTIINSIAERVGFDVSIVLLRMKPLVAFTTEDKQIHALALDKTVEKVLRHTDVLFNRQYGEYDYTVVLPNTSFGEAKSVAHKLRKEFILALGEENVRKVELCAAVQPLYRFDPEIVPEWKEKRDVS